MHLQSSEIRDAACDTVEQAQSMLAMAGWAVLSPGLMPNGARAALAHFGRILPQYNEQDTWEVRAKPGFEQVPYSQSSNGIGPHTEAPVMDPPPKYLALYCHRQARCGGGHTRLADGFVFCDRHGGQQHFESLVADFFATPTPESKAREHLRTSLLNRSAEGLVFRFSHNQFRYGDVNPAEEALSADRTALRLDQRLVEMSDQAQRFFDEEGIAILVPDSSLLIWDNHRMMHARSRYEDKARHLTRYWLGGQGETA